LTIILKKVVVLSGAGISAESGIRTFRDSGGLWEDHDILEVASPNGWQRDPELVLNFYNKRRQNVRDSAPNEGHYALAELAQTCDVQIVTQNIDDLHERAGSQNVLHLHGEILKVKSSVDEELVYEWPGDLHLGDLCEKGSQLRPHVVWFGEAVPLMEIAARIVLEAEVLVIVGTSLNVYPAAGLIEYAAPDCRKFLVDPNIPEQVDQRNIECVAEGAGTGISKVIKMIQNG
jgi:NAD-dependent deacetylase